METVVTERDSEKQGLQRALSTWATFKQEKIWKGELPAGGPALAQHGGSWERDLLG